MKSYIKMICLLLTYLCLIMSSIDAVSLSSDEEIETPGLSAAGTIDYLIITNEELKNTGVFQPLIDSKIGKGLSVAIESVETIDIATPGRDIQEKIRNFIRDKHTNDGLIWVLLGGDTNIIPARFIEMTGYFYNMASDMYYSDLDGDWDADQDNKFGEFDDSLDLYPDVFVGRAPVESHQEAEAFVNKVLTYEANIVNYANTALFLGDTGSCGEGDRISDFIDEQYIPQSVTVTKYYERELGSYADLTIDAINQGQHIINHIGDAGVGDISCGFDYDGNYLITITDVDNLDNTSTPSIFWSSGCNAAQIELDCIAEHWITNPNGGGVAFIGNSGTGFEETTGYLDPSFYESLFLKGITHIGQAHADSKIPFIGEARTSQPMRYCMLELNLLGDPEMSIYTEPDAQVCITSPASGNYVKGNIDIYGSAYTKDGFSRYELYYAPKDNPDNINLIYSSFIPVQDGLLTPDIPWDTTQCTDGEYILILRVIKTDGSVIEGQHNIGITVDNINNPPEFVSLLNRGAVINRLLEFKVDAKDLDDPDTVEGQLTYSANSLPVGASFNPETQVFSWLPIELGDRTYEVSFTVRDNTHTSTQNITLRTLYIEEGEITPNPDSHQDVERYPKIYGDKVVWINSSSDNRGVIMYDITTQEEIEIWNGQAKISNIYDNKVVVLTESCDLYFVDLVTLEKTYILTDTNIDRIMCDLYLYENRIVWDGGSLPDYDIYYCEYDPKLSQQNIIPICIAPGEQSWPVVYGDKIIWQDKRNGNWDIYMYDLSSGKETPICTYPRDQDFPAICKDKVIWLDERNGNNDIYMYDFSSGEESCIILDPHEQFYPVIWEDKIVWQDGRNTKMDIYIYDLLINELTQITDTVDIQEKPWIHDNRIVWIDRRNTDYDSGKYDKDIYLATLFYNEPIRTPVLDPIGDKEIKEGKFLEFKVTSYDPGGDKLVLSVANKPDGADFVDNGDGTGVFKWIPGYYQAGEYEVIFTVSNGECSNSETVTIEVIDSYDGPPTVDIHFSKDMVKAGEEFTITVKGSSPYGLSMIWWFGDKTTMGIPCTVNDKNYSSLYKAFTAAGGGEIVAEQTWRVKINKPDVFTIGANSRDVKYTTRDGKPHQASEGYGIPYKVIKVE